MDIFKNIHRTFRDGQSAAINFFTWKNNTAEGSPTERSLYMDIRTKQPSGYAAVRLNPLENTNKSLVTQGEAMTRSGAGER